MDASEVDATAGLPSIEEMVYLDQPFDFTQLSLEQLEIEKLKLEIALRQEELRKVRLDRRALEHMNAAAAAAVAAHHQQQNTPPDAPTD
ncbi:hypothetical protein Pmar_PMAR000961 [Perkinsus marinus ATCC 50983]|uniref:Uncharacterized protein n=1 Tax=Perkinsus marinus (strain ATCC 50983 / TXsc) TaxID=423536 RepID=C5KP13_PERM5|nr:hypothetical protein Pmar_PMAR014666 [Perkinsus marinus ATCC 50983]XP_002782006.1 hypothetical protein Pmar_PMAR000961 [Perkinsus marinus ATCC 50983]EER03447.1 hypothetical protein Pmar_PMAR014666 [Perkinsus marinus ATCC 50983]EER13801.1 hypothetical protein Pmar_PMAR000961 [Perkinsus marinus ATCC 50983]|eukprot:XP_002771631.1 hypothetical protein Pmar_PMAR014666 [Perkinsus marinus ATCC 50983]